MILGSALMSAPAKLWTISLRATPIPLAAYPGDWRVLALLSVIGYS